MKKQQFLYLYKSILSVRFCALDTERFVSVCKFLNEFRVRYISVQGEIEAIREQCADGGKEASGKFNQAISALMQEIIDFDTRILTEDEFFAVCQANKTEITSEQIMNLHQYLVV